MPGERCYLDPRHDTSAVCANGRLTKCELFGNQFFTFGLTTNGALPWPCCAAPGTAQFCVPYRTKGVAAAVAAMLAVVRHLQRLLRGALVCGFSRTARSIIERPGALKPLNRLHRVQAGEACENSPRTATPHDS